MVTSDTDSSGGRGRYVAEPGSDGVWRRSELAGHKAAHGGGEHVERERAALA
jgi:hypothetical protein